MAIIVFFVMVLIVRERAWEIGTLKALGAPTGGIVLGFLTEAVALCAMGGVLAMVVFAALGGPLAQQVFALAMGPFLPAHYKDSLAETLAFSGIGPGTIGLPAALAIVVAVVGSAYGIRQIIRLSPLAAMRHE